MLLFFQYEPVLYMYYPKNDAKLQLFFELKEFTLSEKLLVYCSFWELVSVFHKNCVILHNKLTNVMANDKGNNTESLYMCFHISNGKYLFNKIYAQQLYVIYCYKGSAVFRINERDYNINFRRFVIIPPRTEVTMLRCSPDMLGYCIGFMMPLQLNDVLNINPNFFPYIMKSPVWRLNVSQRPAMKGFCQTFYYVCNEMQSDIKSDIVSSLFSSFLKIFYESSKLYFEFPNALQNINNRSLTIKFFQNLAKHYSQDHRVIFYADMQCVSSKYLTSIVKSTTGCTPKTIIDRKLATEAVYQLGRTTRTVQEISINLGFPDQSYFGRFFKRMFGISPNTYRSNPNLDILMKLNWIVDSVDEG